MQLQCSFKNGIGCKSEYARLVVRENSMNTYQDWKRKKSNFPKVEENPVLEFIGGVLAMGSVFVFTYLLMFL